MEEKWVVSLVSPIDGSCHHILRPLRCNFLQLSRLHCTRHEADLDWCCHSWQSLLSELKHLGIFRTNTQKNPTETLETKHLVFKMCHKTPSSKMFKALRSSIDMAFHKKNVNMDPALSSKAMPFIFFVCSSSCAFSS